MKNIIEKIYYPYYYLFFRLYTFNKFLFSKLIEDNWPLVGGVSSFQLFNLLSIQNVVEYYLQCKVLRDEIISTTLILTLFALNTLIFLWKGRDKKIIAMFGNETLKQKNISIIFTWIYIIGSYAFLFYSLSLN